MQFGKKLSDVEDFSGGKTPLLGKAYPVYVVSSEEFVSGAGNPCYKLVLDIASGECANFFNGKLNYIQNVATEIGLQVTKRVLAAFSKSQPKEITEDEVNSDSFDFAKLNSKIAGCVFKQGKKGYIEVSHFISINNIDEYNEKNKSKFKERAAKEKASVDFGSDDII